MDQASQALAEVFSASESAPYRAVSEMSKIAAKHISETFSTLTRDAAALSCAFSQFCDS
jgi:hypothetical protein